MSRFSSVFAHNEQEMTVLTRDANGSNSFGNTEWTFTETATVYGVLSYDNRNTEVQGNAGDRIRDAPLFFFSHDDWDLIGDDDRIRTQLGSGRTVTYELQAPTVYPTHVEIFAEVVN